MEERNIFKLISRLLIAFGVLFINLFLFSLLAEYVCKAFYNISVSNYLNSSDYETASQNELGAIRLFQGLVSFGTFIVSSFVIAVAFRQRPLEYLGLESFPKQRYLLFIPILLFASMPFLSWLLEVNGQLQLPSFLSGVETGLKAMELKQEKIYELMLKMNDYGHLTVNLFVMALIPAIGEELFCRGVLLNIIYDYSGKFLRSVVVVAFIFTLFHMQVYKFVPMMVLATLLGLFINWTQGIWASILFHFFNNAMAVAGSFYYERGYKNFFTDENAPVPFLMTVISFFITIAILVYLNNYSKKTLPLKNE